MPAVQLPSPPEDTPYYTQRTQLDGVDYLCSFNYNFRTELWHLHLQTLGGESIVRTTLQPGNNMLSRATHASRPRGTLLCVSRDGSNEHPDLTAWGARVDLIYVPAGETL